MVDRAVSRALFKREPAPAAAGGPSRKKQKRPSFCNQYNHPNGCRNQKTATGCVTQNGLDLLHGCNVRRMDSGKMCNATDHTAMNHKD